MKLKYLAINTYFDNFDMLRVETIWKGCVSKMGYTI